MTDPDGGFYCAEDADSVPPEQGDGFRQGDGSPYGTRKPVPHKTEGAFYLWRADEVDALLGDDAARRQATLRDRAGRQCPVRSAAGIHRQEPSLCGAIDRRAGGRVGKTRDEIVDILNRGRVAMFQHRLQRPRPDRDDKILTVWNGLMIAAFARTARVLGAADAGALTPPGLLADPFGRAISPCRASRRRVRA